MKTIKNNYNNIYYLCYNNIVIKSNNKIQFFEKGQAYDEHGKPVKTVNIDIQKLFNNDGSLANSSDIFKLLNR